MDDGSETSYWLPAPKLTEEELVGSAWQFGVLGKAPYSTFVVLAPNNLIGNYRTANEEVWIVQSGRLELISTFGIATTKFDYAQVLDNKLIALAGRFFETDIIHELRRTEHPSMPDSLPLLDRRAHFLKVLKHPRRPNLVVLRGGNSSLHTQWNRDIEDRDRSWDLCLSYYGNSVESYFDEPEYFALQASQRKFQAIFDLLYPESPLWGYDRVWLPDDDLMTSWSDINRLFHLHRWAGLDLAQPALKVTPECFINHNFTSQQSGKTIRDFQFVEVMCPLFSKRALKVCYGSFRDSFYGFGLDHLWPSLLGGPKSRIGIIDAVGVIHTRPFAANYEISKAKTEERALLNSYQWLPFK